MSNPQCASLLLNTANTAFNVPKIHNIDTSSFNHGHGASSSFTNTDNTQQEQLSGYSNYNADNAGDAGSSQAKAYDAWANYLINKFKNGWDANTAPMTPTGGFIWTDDYNENVYERSKNDDSNKAKQWKGLNSNSGSAAATGGMPPDGWEPDDEKWKEWSKNSEGKWHHSNAEDFEGIANRPNTQDPKLQKLYKELYRPTDEVPGGSAQALREEVRAGHTVPKHLQKVQDRLIQITNRLSNLEEPLSRSDRLTAERVQQDLRNALDLYKGTLK